MLSAVVQNPVHKLVKVQSAAATGAPLPICRALFGLDATELKARMLELGQPSWRARQLAEALYRQWIEDLEAVTTLPGPLRSDLAGAGWCVGRPRVAHTFTSTDGTERYLVEVGGDANPLVSAESADVGTDSRARQTVETVWMPEGDGSEPGCEPGSERGSGFGDDVANRAGGDASHVSSADAELQPQSSSQRATICVSSQVGCAVNCQFCLTAKLGLQRNLTAGEIAGQVIAVLARHHIAVGRDRVNLVFMGMGEPFLNYENFMAAVRLLVEEVGLSPQRMTVSTSGIVPGIERFAAEPAAVRPRLAISLNAPNNDLRSELMPINTKWPIEALVEAVRRIPLRPRERITFEYVLLGGVTDQPAHAVEVARLIRRTGLAAKVNLIAWNPGPGIAYKTPHATTVARFQQTLINAGIPTYLRRPRGRDIFAACGQLKRTVEEARTVDAL